MSRAFVLLMLALTAGACATGTATRPRVQPSQATVSVPGLPAVPARVYDTRTRAFINFDTMLTDLAGAAVVLVGEQHDDPNSHRLESALLQGLAQRKVAVTLSLEMFERDVQPALDAYLAGRNSEDLFLKDSRPWPRYATDYRPLVELAKAQAWPVLAANVPRKYASDIAKNGLAPLDALGSSERQLVARELQCPIDGYFDRFAESMGSHPEAAGPAAPAAAQRATLERYYQSQCAKDETMAESIAAGAQRPGTIVHFTGAFHSDFGTGTAERVRRRLPGRRVAVVTLLPVDRLDRAKPGADDLKRAEYLVYTVRESRSVPK